jgi:hypothetical protein
LAKKLGARNTGEIVSTTFGSLGLRSFQLWIFDRPNKETV